jgi:hypothetical protein
VLLGVGRMVHNTRGWYELFEVLPAHSPELDVCTVVPGVLHRARVRTGCSTTLMTARETSIMPLPQLNFVGGWSLPSNVVRVGEIFVVDAVDVTEAANRPYEVPVHRALAPRRA